MAVIAIILFAIGLFLLCISFGLGVYWFISKLRETQRSSATNPTPMEQSNP